MNFKGKNFLKMLDFSSEEINYLIDLSLKLKDEKKQGKSQKDYMAGKNIALIFEKTSTRTHCSFEVAAYDMGACVTYLDPSGSQIGKKESIPDTARVLGRMFDGIEYRGFEQTKVEELAKYAGVPVDVRVAAIFRPICPDFPMPVTITLPLQFMINSTARLKSSPMVFLSFNIELASISSTFLANSVTLSFSINTVSILYPQCDYIIKRHQGKI